VAIRAGLTIGEGKNWRMTEKEPVSEKTGKKSPSGTDWIHDGP
jgi:hypothetical protein